MQKLKRINIYGSRGRSSTRKYKKINSSDKSYALNLFQPNDIKYFEQCRASINIDVYNHMHDTNIKSVIPYNEANDFLCELFSNYKNCYNFLNNYCNAKYQRLKRVRKKISDILAVAIERHWNIYFISNTFRDSTLERLNEKSRRRAVVKWYEKVSFEYIANIDYGTKKQREHYHRYCYCSR